MRFLLIILIILFLYFITRKNRLEKQVDLFNKLLYIDKSPKKYIAEVDKLLLKIQSERERNINLIQKTTGLFFAGEFDEAVKILTEDVTKIPPNWQVVYYHNLLLSLYFNGDRERANEMLREVRDVIDVYYKKDYNKVTIELIYAISDFYNGNISNCKEFFANLIDVARNDYRVAFGCYFSGKIQEAEGKTDEAQESLEEARICGRGSFIEKL